MTTKRHRKRIARELPPVGTNLQGKFKGETYTATIVEAEGLPAGRGSGSGRSSTRRSAPPPGPSQSSQ